MKPLKKSLRLWIAITSLVSFLAGWVVFSHAGKPAPLFSSSNNTQSNVSNTIDPIPTLPPVPSLNNLVTNSGSVNTGSNSTIQPLPSIPSNNTITRSFPRIRTGGS